MSKKDAVQGIDGLRDLISKLSKRENYLHQINGTEYAKWQKRTNVDGQSELKYITGNEPVMQGDFLHQDSENITERESAQFEQDNPELFKQLLRIKKEIYRTLE